MSRVVLQCVQQCFGSRGCMVDGDHCDVTRSYQLRPGVTRPHLPLTSARDRATRNAERPVRGNQHQMKTFNMA